VLYSKDKFAKIIVNELGEKKLLTGGQSIQGEVVIDASSPLCTASLKS
jgi:hypothetical protein